MPGSKVSFSHLAKTHRVLYFLLGGSNEYSKAHKLWLVNLSSEALKGWSWKRIHPHLVFTNP